MTKRWIPAIFGLLLCNVLCGCDFASMLYPATESPTLPSAQTVVHAPKEDRSTAPTPAMTAEPSPDAERVTGFSFAEAVGERQIVPIDYVMETSNKDSRLYGKYAVDGDTATCWTALPEDGEPTLGMRFFDQYAVDGIVLLLGDNANEEAYQRSGRALEVEISFSEEDVQSFTVEALEYGRAWVAEFPARVTEALAVRVVRMQGAEHGASIAEAAVLTTGRVSTGEEGADE